MIDANGSKHEVLAEIEKAVGGLHEAVDPLTDEEINTIPYKDSWTAAQLLRHVTKSATGLARAMLAPAQTTEREPRQRIGEFQKVLLDFSTKLQSPEFIVPENDRYKKAAVLESLDHSFSLLKESAAIGDLNCLVKDLPFGDATKIELLYFVLYHTERHLNQLHKICGALKTAAVKN